MRPKKRVAALLVPCLLLVASSAWAWELSQRSREEYEALRTPDTVRLEGWLSNLRDGEEANSFRELARGTLLWSTKKPRGGLADLVALFDHADQKESADSVDPVLRTERGKVVLGIRLETDLCT